MLGVVVENYSVLKNQVIDLLMKSRKRKAAPGCDNCCNFNRSASDQYCGCCSDDNDSCYNNKRPRENNSKPKVMRVLVPTPVSDSTLVRIHKSILLTTSSSIIHKLIDRNLSVCDTTCILVSRFRFAYKQFSYSFDIKFMVWIRSHVCYICGDYRLWRMDINGGNTVKRWLKTIRHQELTINAHLPLPVRWRERYVVSSKFLLFTKFQHILFNFV